MGLVGRCYKMGAEGGARSMACDALAGRPLLIPIGGKLPVRLWELPVKPRTSAIGVVSGQSGSGNKTRERTRIHHQIGMTANDPISSIFWQGL